MHWHIFEVWSYREESEAMAGTGLEVAVKGAMRSRMEVKGIDFSNVDRRSTPAAKGIVRAHVVLVIYPCLLLSRISLFTEPVRFAKAVPCSAIPRLK